VWDQARSDLKNVSGGEEVGQCGEQLEKIFHTENEKDQHWRVDHIGLIIWKRRGG